MVAAVTAPVAAAPAPVAAAAAPTAQATTSGGKSYGFYSGPPSGAAAPAAATTLPVMSLQQVRNVRGVEVEQG